MADHQIAVDQQGAYEIEIPADTVVTVELEQILGAYVTSAQIIAHAGTAPIYAAIGDTVEPRQANAFIVGQGTWTDVSYPASGALHLAITSEEDAIVSAARR